MLLLEVKQLLVTVGFSQVEVKLYQTHKTHLNHTITHTVTYSILVSLKYIEFIAWRNYDFQPTKTMFI